VTVWHDFPTPQGAKDFASSSRLKEVMIKAGVKGVPQIWFVNQRTETALRLVLRRTYMVRDGFPRPMAVVLGIVLAFGVSLFVLAVMGGWLG